MKEYFGAFREAHHPLSALIMNQLINYLQLAQNEFAVLIEDFDPSSSSSRLFKALKGSLDYIVSVLRWIDASLGN